MCRADLNFEVHFGVNGAIGTIEPNGILVYSDNASFSSIIIFFKYAAFPLRFVRFNLFISTKFIEHTINRIQCRYGLNRVPVDERLCEACNAMKDGCHVMMWCSLYTDIRDQLFKEICDISSYFPALIQDEPFIQIMSNPLYYRCASRAMYNILNRRRCSMLR